VAKRNRYREMESLMTKVIVGDALVFVLYLLFAGLGLTVVKVATAIIAILGSLLGLGWLVITGEFSRRRSLWMVTGFIAIVLCVLVSLLLGYPGPAPTV
jgi:ABC-type proline/glycine betaine transport system permease subunit